VKKKRAKIVFTHMILFLFSMIILGRCIWVKTLVVNTKCIKIIFEKSISKFTLAFLWKILIWEKNLVFHIFLKLSENIIKFIFEFQMIKQDKS
jgi:hypothetical protein